MLLHSADGNSLVSDVESEDESASESNEEF